MSIPYTLTSLGITFVFGGRPYNIEKNHANFSKIKEKVVNGITNGLTSLVDIKTFVAKATFGKVQISDDEVRYDGIKVPVYLAQRVIEHHNNNEPVTPILRFLEKLMQNPNKEIREDLFKWMENANMPIYPDGDFLAYKKVQNDYNSYHSGRNGKVHHGIGEVVSMPRSECDENRNSTCSTGLHFCSFNYLPHYFGNQGIVVTVKINPMNVTAIPTDYGLSKGRCCEYYVSGKIEEDQVSFAFSNVVVVHDENYDSTEDYDSWEDSWDEAWDDVQENVETTKDAEESEVDYVVYKKTGEKFSFIDILNKVDDVGITKAAEYYNVPRSTFRSWHDKALDWDYDG